MTDNRPIGVFDSGLGGLGAVKELRRLLPSEDIIYFGDTGRVPYGSKSPETILRYAREDVGFLMRFDVKAVVAACGTVSAVALEKLKPDIPVPSFGVIDSAVRAAAGATKNGKVAVIGTDATIKSGIFEKKLAAAGVQSVISRACPLLVYLVECGFTDRQNSVTRDVCASYLSDVKESGADTLILGCTHFPIIADVIADTLPGVALIDPAKETAGDVARALTDLGLRGNAGGKTSYYVSDDAESFSASAKIFIKSNEKISAVAVKI